MAPRPAMNAIPPADMAIIMLSAPPAVPLRLAGQRVAQRGVEPAQHELQLVGAEHLRQHPLGHLAEPELEVVAEPHGQRVQGRRRAPAAGPRAPRRGPCRCGRRSRPAARRCRCAAGRSPRPGRAGSRCSAPATTAATRCACGRPARPVRRGPGPRRPGPGRWRSSVRRWPGRGGSARCAPPAARSPGCSRWPRPARSISACCSSAIARLARPARRRPPGGMVRASSASRADTGNQGASPNRGACACSWARLSAQMVRQPG